MWGHFKDNLIYASLLLIWTLIILLSISTILLVIYLFSQEFFFRYIEFILIAAALIIILLYYYGMLHNFGIAQIRGGSFAKLRIGIGDRNRTILLAPNIEASSEEIERIVAALGGVLGTSASAHNAIQEELKQLREGKILFNPNKYMRVGNSEIIEARISKSLSADLGEGLKGRGEPIVEELSVGDVMKANVSGDGFDIKRMSSAAQVVPDDDFAHWTWSVTPIKSGRRTLTLLVSVQIKVRGVSDTSRDMPVFERDVEVLINPVYTTRRFLAANWKWIAGTITIPPIIWAVNEAGLLDGLKTWLSSIANSGSGPAP